MSPWRVLNRLLLAAVDEHIVDPEPTVPRLLHPSSMRADAENVIALNGLRVVDAEDEGMSVSALDSTTALSDLEGGASVALAIDMKGVVGDSTSAIASSVDVSHVSPCPPRTHEFYILPIPNHLRHDPAKPRRLHRLLHYTFAITCTICEYFFHF